MDFSSGLFAKRKSFLQRKVLCRRISWCEGKRQRRKYINKKTGHGFICTCGGVSIGIESNSFWLTLIGVMSVIWFLLLCWLSDSGTFSRFKERCCPFLQIILFIVEGVAREVYTSYYIDIFLFSFLQQQISIWAPKNSLFSFMNLVLNLNWNG